MQFRDTFCIILPNFVKIGHTVAEIGLSQNIPGPRFFLAKCKIH